MPKVTVSAMASNANATCLMAMRIAVGPRESNGLGIKSHDWHPSGWVARGTESDDRRDGGRHDRSSAVVNNCRAVAEHELPPQNESKAQKVQLNREELYDAVYREE
jgi:hypothetical protein